MALKNWAIYIISLLSCFILLSEFGFDFRQTMATTIVFALVMGTVLFWDIRLAFALIGVALLFASGLISVSNFIFFSSLDIIVFLAGMMIFVGFLEKNAFFEFLIGAILELIGGGGKRIIVLMMVMSAVFAAMVDEVTSILFMLSIMMHLTAKVRVNPLPFVIMLVFATNIGSSATAIGNPVGVMIALNAKLSFTDFLTWATPISVVSLFIGIVASFVYFRKEILEFSRKAKAMKPGKFIGSPAVHAAPQNLFISGALFVLVLSALIMHSQIENLLGLEKNTMLIGTALATAGVVLLLEAKNARHFVETKVDWWTLFFFLMLFASVGALEETGVMELAAKALVEVVQGSPTLALGVVMTVSGVLSAVLDNVLAVAVFVPLIKDLQMTSIGGNYLWWSLLFGATFFGNLTLIGSTANIIALGMLEKRGLPKISFMQWFKAGFFIVFFTVPTAFLMLYLQMDKLVGVG